jgi:hypothetical protein
MKLQHGAIPSRFYGKFVTITFKITGHAVLCFVPPGDSPARQQGYDLCARCCSEKCRDLLAAEEPNEVEVREIVEHAERN